MVQTAEQYSNHARFYENLTEDDTAPLEQRAAFARKANWLRILARLAAWQEEAGASRACKEKQSQIAA